MEDITGLRVERFRIRNVCVRWADMESNFRYFLEKLVFYQGIVNVNRELKGVGNNVYYL